ncbi:MAG: Thiol:disulfide interchange protein DsbC [Steroidobacteraceae bacterium]|nr:Thiol:disulfide interchange protein DsbC [Steroidobacteraceae bacterium]
MLRTATLILSLALLPALVQADVRTDLVKKFPGATVDDLRPTPMQGIFELRRGGDIVYVSEDGRYALMGDLYDLKSNSNLSETRRRGLRKELLSAVPDSQTLIFSPKDPKYTINVFTDVDCAYCRKLHSQIAEYNRLGVRVRYLFFPRTGPDTESWHKAESVWCAADRNEALTRAKRGEAIKSRPCGQTPVAKEYQLGEDLGIQGTPAIVLANGEMLPGYVPPAMLVDHLKTVAR